VIVAVAGVGVVQVAVDDVVGVVAVRDGVVAAGSAVDVVLGVAARAMRRGAVGGVGRADGERVLVDMPRVRVMEVPVVEEVLVPVVLDRLVAAARPVLVIVAFVGLVVRHGVFLAVV
jgi:hypothetical protein